MFYFDAITKKIEQHARAHNKGNPIDPAEKERRRANRRQKVGGGRGDVKQGGPGRKRQRDPGVGMGESVTESDTKR